MRSLSRLCFTFALLGIPVATAFGQHATPTSASFAGTPASAADASPATNAADDAVADVPEAVGKSGKRVKVKKVKPPKTHPIEIVNGTLTVDGWTGKAQLNYAIPDLKFIFVSVPSIGTVIVGQAPFPGAVEQKEAFNAQTLTVKVGEHEVQLASDRPLLHKKPESAWVKIDPLFTEDARYPVMGYGTLSAAPYDWPAVGVAKANGSIGAPPLPEGMRPKTSGSCVPGRAQSCGVATMAAAQSPRL